MTMPEISTCLRCLLALERVEKDVAKTLVADGRRAVWGSAFGVWSIRATTAFERSAV